MPSNYSRNTGKFIFLADILKNSVCDKVTGIEMYKAPDVLKVDLNVKDVFANYLMTGCPEDENGSWTYTVPCEGTSEYEYVTNTFTGLGFAYMCYSTHNP